MKKILVIKISFLAFLISGIFISCQKGENLDNPTNITIRKASNDDIIIQVPNSWGDRRPSTAPENPEWEGCCPQNGFQCNPNNPFTYNNAFTGDGIYDTELLYLNEVSIRVISPIERELITEENFQNAFNENGWELPEDFDMETAVNTANDFFDVPVNIEFEKEVAKMIISENSIKASTITALKGMYKIKYSKDYPNGYFDMKIKMK